MEPTTAGLTCLAMILVSTIAGCLDGDSRTPDDPNPMANGECASAMGSLTPDVCIHASRVSITLQDCIMPDATFRLPHQMVPATPYPFPDSNIAVVELHATQCASAAINGTSIGPVSMAWVGPFVVGSPGLRPGVSSYQEECVTDNPTFLMWLRTLEVPCHEGLIDIARTPSSPLGLETMRLAVMGPGSYESPERLYEPSVTLNHAYNRLVGPPEDGFALQERFINLTLGEASPGAVRIDGGYLGQIGDTLITTQSLAIAESIVWEPYWAN